MVSIRSFGSVYSRLSPISNHSSPFSSLKKSIEKQNKNLNKRKLSIALYIKSTRNDRVQKYNSPHSRMNNFSFSPVGRGQRRMTPLLYPAITLFWKKSTVRGISLHWYLARIVHFSPWILHRTIVLSALAETNYCISRHRTTYILAIGRNVQLGDASCVVLQGQHELLVLHTPDIDDVVPATREDKALRLVVTVLDAGNDTSTSQQGSSTYPLWALGRVQ